MDKIFNKIVITTGTSLLNRNNVFYNFLSDLIDSKNGSIEKKDPSLDDMQVIAECSKAVAANINKIDGQETHVSAEYSIMYSLAKENTLGTNPVVELINTDTFAGLCISILLETIFKEKFHATVTQHKSKYFNVNSTNQDLIQQSFGNFMDVTGKVLRKYHNQDDVCFAPIGGFKVMCYLSYMVSSFYKLPIYYLHETSQNLCEIPPMPVSIDDKALNDNVPLFMKLQNNIAIELSALPKTEQDYIEKNKFFFEFNYGRVRLNAFGKFIIDSDKYYDLFHKK